MSCIVVDSLSVYLGAECHHGWANNKRIIVQVGCCSSPRSLNRFTNSLPPQSRTQNKVSSHCHWLRLRYSKWSAQVTVWSDCDFFGKVEQIFFQSLPPPLLEVTWHDRCLWWQLPLPLIVAGSADHRLISWLFASLFPSFLEALWGTSSLPCVRLPSCCLTGCASDTLESSAGVLSPRCAKWPYRRRGAIRPTCVLRIERLIRFLCRRPWGGREMTKEDVSEDVRGEAVLGWASTHQRPVVHQVASAPMPSDCGEASHTQTHTH